MTPPRTPRAAQSSSGDDPVLLVRVQTMERARSLSPTFTMKENLADSGQGRSLVPSAEHSSRSRSYDSRFGVIRPARLVRALPARTSPGSATHDVFPGGPATQHQRHRSRPPLPQVHEHAEPISNDHSLRKRANGVAAIKKTTNYKRMAEMRAASPDHDWPVSPDPKTSVQALDSKRTWETLMQVWIEEIRISSGNPEQKPEPAWVRRNHYARCQSGQSAARSR